ncbi:MAG: endonuclease, partial [Prolixibacteraceae bacterium]|nr:endonuclease [Prolixibacteraceae bacterium]
MRFIFIILQLLIWTSAFSQVPAGYYDAANKQSGIALQQSLHDIIDNHTVVTYSGLWTAFQSTDAKTDGTVWDIYSDRPGGTPDYVYNFGSHQCGNYSAEGDCYNREHTFPQSW